MEGQRRVKSQINHIYAVITSMVVGSRSDDQNLLVVFIVLIFI